MILEDLISKRHTVTRVPVVEELAPGDAYDLVIVAMRREQIADVLPVLEAADRVGTVLFLHSHAAARGNWLLPLNASGSCWAFPARAVRVKMAS
jgi:hypothetical protein